MEFLLILLFFAIAIVIFKLLALGEKLELSKSNQYLYFKNSYLLTPAEISFRQVFKIAIDDSYEVDSKVRSADVICVHKGLTKSEWSRSLNMIKAKHLDYVLVDKVAPKVLCRIELDDSSHSKQAREDRDSFSNVVIQSASLLLLRFKASQAYKCKDIKGAINLL